MAEHDALRPARRAGGVNDTAGAAALDLGRAFGDIVIGLAAARQRGFPVEGFEPLSRFGNRLDGNQEVDV